MTIPGLTVPLHLHPVQILLGVDMDDEFRGVIRIIRVEFDTSNPEAGNANVTQLAIAPAFRTAQLIAEQDAARAERAANRPVEAYKGTSKKAK
jgi:hypothetical protein